MEGNSAEASDNRNQGFSYSEKAWCKRAQAQARPAKFKLRLAGQAVLVSRSDKSVPCVFHLCAAMEINQDVSREKNLYMMYLPKLFVNDPLLILSC
jgi:hypothetical protein